MEIIDTNKAPKAIGSYSQAVKSNGLVFCSGQIALNENGDLVDGDCSVQTEQIMNNLKNVLEEAGSSLDKVVKTTIYLADINDFSAVNEAYGSFFLENKPARATVEVSCLPKNVKVEIDCIAEL